MRKDVFELPPYLRVIRIPRLYDAGVGSPKLPDEGDDPDSICDHGEGVPLGHALLAVQEVCFVWDSSADFSATFIIILL